MLHVAYGTFLSVIYICDAHQYSRRHTPFVTMSRLGIHVTCGICVECQVKFACQEFRMACNALYTHSLQTKPFICGPI